MNKGQRPFFTIALAAYKRDVLLKESVASCLGQVFRDFELLIGNDDPSLALTPQMFGGDARIRIINRRRNLGASGNMNALIQEAHGLYFVWLADDDLFMPDFLSAVHGALTKEKGTRCVYTSYMAASKPPENFMAAPQQAGYLTGREFLKIYLGRESPISGWYGVFEIGLMKDMGGMKQLGHTWDAPCSDMLLPLQVAQAGRVAFIDSPLIFSRLHAQSISTVSPDHEAYKSSQLAFLEVAMPILLSEGLKEDFARNMYWIMKSFAGDYFEVMRRSGGKKWWQAFQYWANMEKFSRQQKGYVWAWRLYMVSRFCWLVKHLLQGPSKDNPYDLKYNSES
jgi:glycosyltransferase involved in cell wall biosynthesis